MRDSWKQLTAKITPSQKTRYQNYGLHAFSLVFLPSVNFSLYSKNYSCLHLQKCEKLTLIWVLELRHPSVVFYFHTIVASFDSKEVDLFQVMFNSMIRQRKYRKEFKTELKWKERHKIMLSSLYMVSLFYASNCAWDFCKAHKPCHS